jgi:hypothetical protein
MWRSRSRSWIIALLVVVGSLALCGRGAAQEPPATEPEQESADQVKPADETKPPASQLKAPASQTKPPESVTRRSPRPGDVQKVLIIRHPVPRSLVDLLAIFPATITHSYYQGATALGISAPPAAMAAIEETIKRLDAPPPPARKNIELTGYILEATSHPGEATSVPSELEGVVAQLKRTFNYAAYRLIDILIARAREYSGLETNAVGGNGQGAPARTFYRLKVMHASVSPEGGATIRLDGLRFGVDIPVPVSAVPNSSFQYRSVGVDTDIDIREGQRVVVGKSGIGDAGNAIILVLSAKVVD